MNVRHHLVIRQPNHNVAILQRLRRFDSAKANLTILVNKENPHTLPQREVLDKDDMPPADQRPRPHDAALVSPGTDTSEIDILQSELLIRWKRLLKEASRKSKPAFTQRILTEFRQRIRRIDLGNALRNGIR